MLRAIASRLAKAAQRQTRERAARLLATARSLAGMAQVPVNRVVEPVVQTRGPKAVIQIDDARQRSVAADAPGHFQTYDRPHDRHANGRFGGTAVIGRRALDGARSSEG